MTTLLIKMLISFLVNKLIHGSHDSSSSYTPKKKSETHNQFILYKPVNVTIIQSKGKSHKSHKSTK